MKSIFYLVLLINIPVYANVINCVKYGKNTNYISSISKITKLGNVTQKSLSLGCKSDNIQDLLNLAVKENKLKFSEQFKYRKQFQTINKGDVILLKCLKHMQCDISNYSKIMTKSSLHRQVALKSPAMNVATSNHAVGKINENIMNKYFKSTGWTKIEGEIGRNGIDGLFIKRNNGVIVDVLIVESKYNKSGLQHTKNGKQMTQQWVSKKIVDLQNKYPDKKEYNTIKKFIVNDSYRAMLWNLKTTDTDLIVSLKKIHDKTGKISTSNLKGSEKMKINFNGNQLISIKYPKNDFHRQFIGWYNQEIKMLSK